MFKCGLCWLVCGAMDQLHSADLALKRKLLEFFIIKSFHHRTRNDAESRLHSPSFHFISSRILFDDFSNKIEMNKFLPTKPVVSFHKFKRFSCEKFMDKTAQHFFHGFLAKKATITAI